MQLGIEVRNHGYIMACIVLSVLLVLNDFPQGITHTNGTGSLDLRQASRGVVYSVLKIPVLVRLIPALALGSHLPPRFGWVPGPLPRRNHTSTASI